MSTQLQQLTALEQQLTQVSGRRAQYNRELLEVQNALSELTSVDEAFHIVGSVMIKKSSKDKFP